MKTKLTAVAAIIGLLLLIPLSASAHDASKFHSNCVGVGASFDHFPNTTNVITVKADTTSVTRSFTGTSGVIDVRWEAFGIDSADGGKHTVTYTWTADGGGSFGPFTVDLSECAPPPTTPTTTPSTAPPTAPPSTTTTSTAPPTTPPPTAPPAPPVETPPKITG